MMAMAFSSTCTVLPLLNVAPAIKPMMIFTYKKTSLISVLKPKKNHVNTASILLVTAAEITFNILQNNLKDLPECKYFKVSLFKDSD